MTARSKTGTTLYLRGVPEQLVREAKALAARRGVTLTALVIEAITQAVGSGGVRMPPEPEDLSADLAWYEANKEQLLAQYLGEYLAIEDRKVIDHDREFGPLAARVFKKLGPRPILMPKCVPAERVVAVPSPRVVRP